MHWHQNQNCALVKQILLMGGFIKRSEGFICTPPPKFAIVCDVNLQLRDVCSDFVHSVHW